MRIAFTVAVVTLPVSSIADRGRVSRRARGGPSAWWDVGERDRGPIFGGALAPAVLEAAGDRFLGAATPSRRRSRVGEIDESLGQRLEILRVGRLRERRIVEQVRTQDNRISPGRSRDRRVSDRDPSVNVRRAMPWQQPFLDLR